MSYNKITLDCSYLDIQQQELENRKERFLLINLANVLNMANSYLDMDNKGQFIGLNMLVSKTGVIIDRVVRTYDCDSDDVIESLFFRFNEVPDEIFLEEYIDYKDYIDIETGRDGQRYDTKIVLKDYKDVFNAFKGGR